jgi:hypothetical protein
MVPTMKKVRFDEPLTMLHMIAVEQTRDSYFESNFNHECRKKEDVEAINDLTNELPHCLSVLPTVETIASNNSSNFSNAISGSKYHYRSRWIMSNNEMKDISPILPLRQNEEPANNIISTAFYILDRHQDAISQSNEYTLVACATT